MKKGRLFISCILACVGITAVGQTTYSEVIADLNRTGGVYYAYPVTESDNTPVPNGYEPVYISHYGRHGSRYLISDRDYASVADVLHNADKTGALTSLGKDVMHRIDTLMLETRGRGGDLTPLGARQHKDIAKRMAKSYPKIFNDKNACITARSTLVPRCILSMAAFCEGLKEFNPSLSIERESSQRYMPYLCYHSDDHHEYTINGKWKEKYRKFKEHHTKPDRLITSLFSDSSYVSDFVNPEELMWGLYWIASDMQNVETRMSFYDIFTPDELFNLWQCFNYVFYVNDGVFAGNGDKVVSNAYPLVANIIESADKALSSGRCAADLRFGHDGNLIPLAAALHLKNCDLVTGEQENFHEAFSDWKIAPMAGNIQLVFFRNKKNPKDILVKFMLNERETSIPIPPYQYPYYHWDDVRTYYKKIIGQ